MEPGILVGNGYSTATLDAITEPASEIVIENEAYLVSRGVRPVAWVAVSSSESECVERALADVTEAIESVSGSWEIKPRAFAVRHYGRDDIVDIVITGYEWVRDVLEWLGDEVTVPAHYANLVCGLMLGYSPSAVQAFHDRCRELVDG